MAETKTQAVKKPVQEAPTQGTRSLEDENRELKEQLEKVASMAQTYYNENQTLRASLKAIASLL